MARCRQHADEQPQVDEVCQHRLSSSRSHAEQRELIWRQGGESKLSYSIDKRTAEMVIYCYLLTTSRQLCDFQAALWRAYLPLSTDVLHQNSGTP